MTYVSPMGAYINTSNESVLSGINSLMSMIQDSISAMESLNSNETGGTFEDDNIGVNFYNSGESQSVLNFAYQFNGKGGGEMSGIISGAGYSFHTGVWCADFVTFVIKSALGEETPAGFGSSSVAGLRTWGESTGRYVDKSQWKQVKPGDVMIQQSNGASHTGIVTKVDSNGTIHTIEGNSSNKVTERTYPPGSSGYNRISGFVMM